MAKDIRDEDTGMTTRILVSDVMNSPIIHAKPDDDINYDIKTYERSSNWKYCYFG